MSNPPGELRSCPVCNGETFEQRYWASAFHGAQLRRKPPWRNRLKDLVDWYVCQRCGHVLGFLSRQA
jgi:hypothetical protein